MLKLKRGKKPEEKWREYKKGRKKGVKKGGKKATVNNPSVKPHRFLVPTMVVTTKNPITL
jgi:hypothetical protein